MSRAHIARTGTLLPLSGRLTIAAICVSALLVACGIPTGPKPIVTADWTPAVLSAAAASDPPTNPGQPTTPAAVSASATASAPATASAAEAASTPLAVEGMGVLAARFNRMAAISLRNPKDGEAAADMLDAGFALIYASCWDYFRNAGQRQHWIIVANDYVTAAGTLATSILALTHAGPAAVTATALVTSTFVAGTSIYTKDFLFAAENIDSVRTLTLNAIVTHQSRVKTDPGALTGYSALVAIMDHQEICTIPQITTLVRKAIIVARPDATDKSGNQVSTIGSTLNLNSAVDKGALAAVSSVVSPAQALTDTQIVALYWYLFGNPVQQEKDGLLCQQLGTLPRNFGPVQAVNTTPAGCTYSKPWPQETVVRQLFNNLSPAAIANINQAIAKLKQGRPATVELPDAHAPLNALGATTAPLKHINIDILK